jgi:hypothetical protein
MLCTCLLMYTAMFMHDSPSFQRCAVRCWGLCPLVPTLWADSVQMSRWIWICVLLLAPAPVCCRCVASLGHWLEEAGPGEVSGVHADPGCGVLLQSPSRMQLRRGRIRSLEAEQGRSS